MTKIVTEAVERFKLACLDMAKSYGLGTPESRAIVTAIEHAGLTAMSTAQEPALDDDALIEQVAQAMCDAVNAGKPPIVQWCRLHREERELYKTAARAALTRLQAKAPETGPKPWTEIMGDPVADMARKLHEGAPETGEG